MTEKKKPVVETPPEDAGAPGGEGGTPAAPEPSQDAVDASTALEETVADLAPGGPVTVTPESLAEAIQTAIAKARPDLFHNSPLSRATEALNHVELIVVPGLTALILKEVF